MLEDFKLPSLLKTNLLKRLELIFYQNAKRFTLRGTDRCNCKTCIDLMLLFKEYHVDHNVDYNSNELKEHLQTWDEIPN